MIMITRDIVVYFWDTKCIVTPVCFDYMPSAPHDHDGKGYCDLFFGHLNVSTHQCVPASEYPISVTNTNRSNLEISKYGPKTPVNHKKPVSSTKPYFSLLILILVSITGPQYWFESMGATREKKHQPKMKTQNALIYYQYPLLVVLQDKIHQL